ncbi:MAG: DUF1292 domain-containing protein [Lachnospiraceae bacterium]|jgi:hypothetical protein|nr:DUF1292 domain-containing protein [Lachnospiraceae bacterium]
MNKATFKLEQDDKETEWYVLEETKLNGNEYILVTDSEPEEDGEAIILKEIGMAENGETLYEVVENDLELDAVAIVFNSLLDDTTLEE